MRNFLLIVIVTLLYTTISAQINPIWLKYSEGSANTFKAQTEESSLKVAGSLSYLPDLNPQFTNNFQGEVTVNYTLIPFDFLASWEWPVSLSYEYTFASEQPLIKFTLSPFRDLGENFIFHPGFEYGLNPSGNTNFNYLKGFIGFQNMTVKPKNGLQGSYTVQGFFERRYDSLDFGNESVWGGKVIIIYPLSKGSSFQSELVFTRNDITKGFDESTKFSFLFTLK